MSAPGRLTDPREFDDIVVRAQPDASLLRIRDIGHAELGAQTYSGFSRLERQALGECDRLPGSRRQCGGDRRLGDQLHGEREEELPRGNRLRGAVQLHHVRPRGHQRRGCRR